MFGGALIGGDLLGEVTGRGLGRGFSVLGGGGWRGSRAREILLLFLKAGWIGRSSLRGRSGFSPSAVWWVIVGILGMGGISFMSKNFSGLNLWKTSVAAELFEHLLSALSSSMLVSVDVGEVSEFQFRCELMGVSEEEQLCGFGAFDSSKGTDFVTGLPVHKGVGRGVGICERGGGKGFVIGLVVRRGEGVCERETDVLTSGV